MAINLNGQWDRTQDLIRRLAHYLPSSTCAADHIKDIARFDGLEALNLANVIELVHDALQDKKRRETSDPAPVQRQQAEPGRIERGCAAIHGLKVDQLLRHGLLASKSGHWTPLRPRDSSTDKLLIKSSENE